MGRNIAYSLLHAKPSGMHHAPGDADANGQQNPAIYPLGMRLAVPAARLLGDAGMNVITRIMGIILAAIAVEMVFAGARALLQT